MGAYIAQELMLTRPELVSQAVLMGTRGRAGPHPGILPHSRKRTGRLRDRASPRLRRESALLESFSPKTLNDDEGRADWIDMFTIWPIKTTPGLVAPARGLPRAIGSRPTGRIATPSAGDRVRRRRA